MTSKDVTVGPESLHQMAHLDISRLVRQDNIYEFIARMKGPEFIPSMPLVTPARKRGEARAMTQEEEEEDVLIQEDDGEELDFERAERLMDEIEGLY